MTDDFIDEAREAKPDTFAVAYVVVCIIVFAVFIAICLIQGVKG
jgi:hypothetical protein